MSRSTLPAQRPPTLSADDLAALHAMLDEQRAFRIEQLQQLSRPVPSGPYAGHDPDIVRSLTLAARAALRDVQAALWRMEDGTYGVCTSCGDAVETHRLEIVPQTARCLRCQRAASLTADSLG
jgi:DnaK suppressor protein